MKTMLGVWLGLIVFGLAACQPKDELISSNAQLAVFGTQAQITIRHSKDQDAEDAIARLDQLFQRLHRDWHPWEAGALTSLNEELQSGQWVALDASLTDLLQRSQLLEQQTNGRFNAAIGQLVRLWGFHTSNYPITSPPPSGEQIAQITQRKPSTLDIEWADSSLEGMRVRSINPAVGLDFSALAKGAAADMACDLLIERGLADSLVNLGGDVLVCGAGTKPWQVAIKDPRQGVLEVLEIRERMAVFTSGQYHRFGEWDGERYAHVLDPSTGYPILHVLQATAIAKDPIVADAAATSLVVAGVEQAQILGETLGLEQWMVVDETGQSQWMKKD